ncbi:ankyrin repeat domain-containing protein [Erythrobacter sp. W53]|uniref:ankyrin repeat domain-containing protein n=1 Tax=Erythrobacter sp. W53 TaxID=3425947 RepID=UPI003D76A41F
MGIAIADAICAEDIGQIEEYFRQTPEQIDVHTFMGGQTWLGYACQKGMLQSARKMIELGFNINMLDREGATPINSAAAHGNSEVVRHLIDSGAELDFPTPVGNPLFGAVQGKSVEIAEMLLDAGIDPLAVYNTDRYSEMDAVGYAIMWGQAEIARVIAERIAKGDQVMVEKLLANGHETAERNSRST